MTMSLVQTVTVGAGGAASIEFTGIPQTGKDLMVVLSLRGTNAGTNAITALTFNGLATTYSGRSLIGNSTAASSGLDAGTIYLFSDGDAATASTFGNMQVYVPNYAGSANKSFNSDFVTENNASTANAALAGIYAGLWANTAAITSLKLVSASSGNTWAQYSTASLYTISTTGATGATVA